MWSNTSSRIKKYPIRKKKANRSRSTRNLIKELKRNNFYFILGKLQKHELPAAVTLCKEVWSPDMGLVTAAFKLKRKDIQDRYQHDINRMYAS